MILDPRNGRVELVGQAADMALCKKFSDKILLPLTTMPGIEVEIPVGQAKDALAAIVAYLEKSMKPKKKSANITATATVTTPMNV